MGQEPGGRSSVRQEAGHVWSVPTFIVEVLLNCLPRDRQISNMEGSYE